MTSAAEADGMLPSASATMNKREWHTQVNLQMRRRVLLQILTLLKVKYGKVDARISYIARRAELALYTQAFSASEYRNPKTVSRRLHSLVVKLHMNNLAHQEDAALGVDQFHSSGDDACIIPVSRVRSHSPTDDLTLRLKRRRVHNPDGSVVQQSRLFFSGNDDLVQQICTFLSADACLQLATTCRSANQIVPAFVTNLSVTTRALEKLTPAYRTSFFRRFKNLERFEIVGDPDTPLLSNVRDELALVRRNVICRSVLISLSSQSLPKLRHASFRYAYVDGLNDRITTLIAQILLDPANYPLLSMISLAGNAVADDGVVSLCDGLTRRPPNATLLELLDLDHNFIGERGHHRLEVLLEEEAERRKGSQRPLLVSLRENLVAPPPAAAA
ncbi:hypothetical protein Poli38472_007456 [Pythium oligandrum]|uniref:Uncharacterized protein n=1 Tax=Pythium oligandrum TaxID=41045 RepID=A0A8K1FNX6_PYTOL|nr:hypothetical protein Poli38472_007456 [Pythium oligandrum]|eukprot:TMW67784.1 hypothetical protein Poli38472_007456 [Pythium oligandrum]